MCVDSGDYHVLILGVIMCVDSGGYLSCVLILGDIMYVDSGDGYANLELTEQCMARNDVRS